MKIIDELYSYNMFVPIYFYQYLPEIYLQNIF